MTQKTKIYTVNSASGCLNHSLYLHLVGSVNDRIRLPTNTEEALALLAKVGERFYVVPPGDKRAFKFGGDTNETAMTEILFDDDYD